MLIVKCIYLSMNLTISHMLHYYSDVPCKSEVYNIERNMWTVQPTVTEETVDCSCESGWQRCPEGQLFPRKVLYLNRGSCIKTCFFP